MKNFDQNEEKQKNYSRVQHQFHSSLCLIHRFHSFDFVPKFFSTKFPQINIKTKMRKRMKRKKIFNHELISQISTQIFITQIDATHFFLSLVRRLVILFLVHISSSENKSKSVVVRAIRMNETKNRNDEKLIQISLFDSFFFSWHFSYFISLRKGKISFILHSSDDEKTKFIHLFVLHN